jgi:hypothetical protein
MSINPAPMIWPATEPQLEDANPRPQPPQPVSENGGPAQTDSGNSPTADTAILPGAPQAAEPPQDEVDVQRDSQTGGDVVIQYKDQSGNLILQVPSSQVLGLERALRQEFREKADAQARAEQTGNEGGQGHGN